MSTVKLQAFYLRFQTAQRVLRVNKSEITGENAFQAHLLRLKITMNQVKRKKRGVRYFCRFGTRGLTFRPRNSYIHVFRALIGFSNF